MDILWEILLLLIGMVLLIKGADFLVDGAVGIARKLKISEIVIGMTILAFGTSAPEISVAFQAFAAGTTDLALGDVMGCAVSNILLLLGIATLIRPIKISEMTLRRDIGFYAIIVTVFVALVGFAFASGSGEIGRIGGVILLLIFSIFLCVLIVSANKQMRKQKKVKAENVVNKRRKKQPKKKMPKLPVLSIMLMVGLVGVIFGSSLVVDAAEYIATAFGLSEKLVAMTVLAIGTSLPELATTINASRKNEQELLVGNIVGSNIFNFCVVLGLPIAVFGGMSVASIEFFDLIVVIAAAVVLLICSKTEKKITRREGVAMLVLFVMYYFCLFIF